MYCRFLAPRFSLILWVASRTCSLSAGFLENSIRILYLDETLGFNSATAVWPYNSDRIPGSWLPKDINSTKRDLELTEALLSTLSVHRRKCNKCIVGYDKIIVQPFRRALAVTEHGCTVIHSLRRGLPLGTNWSYRIWQKLSFKFLTRHDIINSLGLCFIDPVGDPYG